VLSIQEPSEVKGIAVAQSCYMERMKELTRDRSYSSDLQAKMRRQALRLGGIVVTLLTMSLLVPLIVKITARYFF
jgi:hypothetical protein